MQENPNTPKTRFATRLGFFVAGFVMAAWAPLVPYAKDNVAADDRVLGNVLLCLGIGSLIAMPLTGALAARFGARLMVFLGGLTIILALPFLAVTTSAVTLGLALLIFGAGMGTLDVAINIHAVEVERGSDRPLMSGFHALFSVGGAVGAGGGDADARSGVHAAACGAVGLGFGPGDLAVEYAWPVDRQGR